MTMKEVILQQQQWRVLLLFLLLAAVAAAAAAAAAGTSPPPPPPLSKPGCNDKCGNESVPYPFGIGDPTCSKSEKFHLKCTYDDDDDGGDQYSNVGGGRDTGKKGRLWYGKLEMSNLSVETGTATTHIQMSYYCYIPPNVTKDMRWFWVDSKSPFTFSSKHNKFTVLGCDTRAILKGLGSRFVAGCLSACYGFVNFTNIVDNGSCSDLGCCQSVIPSGFTNLTVDLKTWFSYIDDYSRCSYAFLANRDWSGFATIDLTDTFHNTHMAPVVLDWVVENQTCQSVHHNDTDIPSLSACGANAYCHDSYNGGGYLCSCKNGYRGNPYLSHGCQDVDECKDPGKHNCEGTCRNTEGNFTCHCPLGTYVDEKGACKGFRVSTLATVVGVCLSLVVMIFFLWMECTRRNKATNFRNNGGTVLDLTNIKIFKEEELKKATRNYHHSQFLGEGGSGSVYKGELPGKELVAIKKPNVGDVKARRGISQFFRRRGEMNPDFKNETKAICSVSHKNVVKLKGLCLETEVPLLVYEFIGNGSLFEHIYSKPSSELNSWNNRLRIAYETAVALKYLHVFATNNPIIHGDIKSKNILLDEKFTTIVADFGASVLNPLKQKGNSNNKIQGTRGYLDPDYLSTGILTEKSDVYSFGVVLVELLTSQKPIGIERPCHMVNYIPYFILEVEKGNLEEVLNCGRLEDKKVEMKQVKAVVELAVICLHRSVDVRPDMTEVVRRLEELNAGNSGARVGPSNKTQEIDSLPGDHYSHSVD